MVATRNNAVLSVDFKCAMTIYAKLRSIVAVVKEDGEDDSSGQLGNSDGEHGSSDGGDNSSKRKASSNYYSSLVQVSN